MVMEVRLSSPSIFTQDDGDNCIELFKKTIIHHRKSTMDKIDEPKLICIYMYSMLVKITK